MDDKVYFVEQTILPTLEKFDEKFRAVLLRLAHLRYQQPILSRRTRN